VQGVFLECAEILPARLFDNVEKIVAQKINVILFFDIEFKISVQLSITACIL
jgi:hypothetical protein